jgi:hypothetical protein
MNQMHLLRRFAQDNAAGEGSLTLSEEERRNLATAITQGLRVMDQFWERATGRKLTDAEKGLE